MFWIVPLSIIRCSSLYTQQWCMSYRFAVSKPVRHISLLCVQWKTPDDGQKNCPKHVEFYSKNKFKKLVHLVGFIIRTVRKFVYLMFCHLRQSDPLLWPKIPWFSFLSHYFPGFISPSSPLECFRVQSCAAKSLCLSQVFPCRGLLFLSSPWHPWSLLLQLPGSLNRCLLGERTLASTEFSETDTHAYIKLRTRSWMFPH